MILVHWKHLTGKKQKKSQNRKLYFFFKKKRKLWFIKQHSKTEANFKTNKKHLHTGRRQKPTQGNRRDTMTCELFFFLSLFLFLNAHAKETHTHIYVAIGRLPRDIPLTHLSSHIRFQAEWIAPGRSPNKNIISWK